MLNISAKLSFSITYIDVCDSICGGVYMFGIGKAAVNYEIPKVKNSNTNDAPKTQTKAKVDDYVVVNGHPKRVYKLDPKTGLATHITDIYDGSWGREMTRDEIIASVERMQNLDKKPRPEGCGVFIDSDGNTTFYKQNTKDVPNNNGYYTTINNAPYSPEYYTKPVKIPLDSLYTPTLKQ